LFEAFELPRVVFDQPDPVAASHEDLSDGFDGLEEAGVLVEGCGEVFDGVVIALEFIAKEEAEFELESGALLRVVFEANTLVEDLDGLVPILGAEVLVQEGVEDVFGVGACVERVAIRVERATEFAVSCFEDVDHASEQRGALFPIGGEPQRLAEFTDFLVVAVTAHGSRPL